ncbi:MAG TPA: anti-sigma factor [Gammaproteobacteria bacterium]|nr:anti-sigma factor [Gammaproteobacteria bacterium]
MRYDKGQLLDALAREYVVGTLKGRARARFGRVLSSSLVARRAVLAWERDLAPLARAVKPVEPPPDAFERIETALGMRAARPTPTRAVGIWPALAAGLALVALIFGGLYFGQRPTAEQATYVAVVNDASTPVWLIQAYVETRAIKTSTINPRPAPPTNSYELWMLQDGANPVSLGVIAGTGATDNPLSDAQLAVLMQTMTLAVSLEPAGGSPTGLPTGPVLFTAPLLRS